MLHPSQLSAELSERFLFLSIMCFLCLGRDLRGDRICCFLWDTMNTWLHKPISISPISQISETFRILG